MFGRPQIEHDQRYERAAELFDVVLRLWAENENYSYSGKSPCSCMTPISHRSRFTGRPIMVNATGSDAGIDFAGRYSDLVFVTSPGGPNMEEALATLPAHNARINRQRSASAAASAPSSPGHSQPGTLRGKRKNTLRR